MTPYYEQDGITIYHGDCREVLPFVSADICIADPPYGIGYESAWGSTRFGPIRGDESVQPDWLSALQPDTLYCFTRWDVLQAWRIAIEATGRKVRDALVWDKQSHGAGDPTKAWAPCYEHVLYASSKALPLARPRPQNVLRFARIDGGAIGVATGNPLVHPSQKPVPLIKHILSKHDGMSVLDPFAGSGSTLVAAYSLGRRAIGIEIEERYCEIAAKRLAQSVLPLETIA
jgi:DNA modification methylase